MGKPLDPAYFRKYRAAHPEYAARDRARSRVRKANRVRGDRTAEYAKRRTIPLPPLPILYAGLQHGVVVSYWHDELRMDLEQERHLAVLARHDPDEAVRAYKRREVAWFMITYGHYETGRLTDDR